MKHTKAEKTRKPRKQKKPGPKPKSPEDKKKVQTYRASPKDAREITRMADLYCDGDVSKWVRYAAMHYRPGKLIKEEVA